MLDNMTLMLSHAKGSKNIHKIHLALFTMSLKIFKYKLYIYSVSSCKMAKRFDMMKTHFHSEDF